MKLNKTRQKLYLDGKVGLINDGTVEQLREVMNNKYNDGYSQKHKRTIEKVQYHPIAWFYENETELPKKVRVDKATKGKEWYADFIGKIFDVTGECDSNHYTVLHLGSKKNYLIDKSDCTPINETNNELPKVGEWWECIEDVKMNSDDRIEFIKGKKYLCEINSCLTNESNEENHYMEECNWFIKHFIKCTPPTPTSYKLNIDIPEWVLKAGDEIELGRLPRSIMEYIATPCITITLENGTEIELTNNDIDKIKKM